MKKAKRQEYDVTVKATLKIRVKAVNAYKAIFEAENILDETDKYFKGADIDVAEYKVLSSSSVDQNA